MKKSKRPIQKVKKVSEKEKLQKLLQQMSLNVSQGEERVARYRELLDRKQLKNDEQKSQKNLRRLDEARRSLEESLVFLGQIREALEKL